jgi:hypothetical protein
MDFQKLEKVSPGAYNFGEMNERNSTGREVTGFSEDKKAGLIRQAKNFGEVYAALREIAKNEPYEGGNNFNAKGEENIIRDIEMGLNNFSLGDISPKYHLQKKVMEILSAGEGRSGAKNFFKRVFH